MTKYETLRGRLIEQGAHQGTIDAFSAEVRVLEDKALANVLRAIMNDRSYSLGDIDPAIIERIAKEVETFHS
jgi:hypothetical protein